MQRALGTVKELVEESKLLPEEVEDAKQATIDRQHSIEIFFLRSAQYNIMKEPSWSLKSELRKVQWSTIGNNADIQAFRLQLARHLAKINMLLSIV